MGKKFGGGGRASGAGNRRFLEHRVDECEKKNLTTVDEIVGFLFSEYGRHYARTPERTLRMNVRKILDESRKKSFIFNERDNDDSKEEGGSNKRIRNKRRRLDGAKEEKLQRREESHIKHRNQGRSSSTSSCESFSSEEETDGAVSTSEDAIYGEEVKPEFDVLKSNLNANYAKSNGAVKTPTRRPVEKNIEVDIASNKARSKMAMHTGEGSGASNRLKGSVLASNVACVGGTEVKATEGPRFKDLGGMKGVLEELMMEVIVPLYHPQLPQRLGVKPIGGILFHGPPGCGKTKLAHAIANETGVPFYKISATEVVSGVSGASEENIRELFSKAYRTAPSIVFIDEIDAIASKRENQQREMERRIVTQLMTCMDESHRPVQPSDKNANVDGSESRPGYVLVIGATNRPDALDSALRRPGRFDREINLGFPDENARIEIFSVLTRNLRLEGSFDYAKIARLTPGFVGADLAAVANQAGMLAMKRIVHARKSELSIDSEDEHSWLRQHWSPEDTENLFITMADFEEAVKQVQASSRREGFSTVPNIKWEDVGGLDHLRQEFDRYVIRRVKFPEDYVDFGVDLETGFLLYGPPGCGKTLIAKAVAHEAGANFIHIKGPELLNKYVGESELAVRTLFSRARTCAPCILFFDEVDALTTKRGKEGGWVVERLLNQLLIELDGAEQRRGVFVIGATNRPDVMDPAVLRPGRFGRLLYVPLPSIDERYSILKALARKKPIDAGIDLHAIAKMDSCENFSGADLAAMVNEAAMAALDEKLRTSERCSHPTPMLNPTPTTIRTVHFEQALAKISPSVTIQQKQYYENLSKKLQNGTGRNMDQISKQSMSFLCP